MDVMDLIEKEAVLAPLQMLSILALNPRLPLHVAANYMSSTLKVSAALGFESKLRRAQSRLMSRLRHTCDFPTLLLAHLTSLNSCCYMCHI